jgi:DNA invertase Pin-like site-specific DNA recombinase/predicted DNA-binding transcriptional regulator AlpA
MGEIGKVTASHRRRTAAIYVRQSTLAQVERNRESTARQYDLVARAVSLGWPRSAIRVIDEDLGMSGASTAGRSGFAELAAQVGLGQIGIVVSLEVSRLARNNTDWYRLLDLAGMTDTLIADADGVYHPAMFNDRLLLGMKGTMSEAELHILRTRLDGGIRNKAARGELRRGLPVGLVWGETDGQILLHPDEAVRGALTAIFEQFPLRGSARAVWLWLKEQGLKMPLQRNVYDPAAGIIWVEPTYKAVRNVLTHPAYAGAYVYGKTRVQRYVDEHGAMRTRRRAIPQDQWQVFLPNHHTGYIDSDTYHANQVRIAANNRPRAHQPGTGAVREGCALLQGLATCGVCARKLAVYYHGPTKATPGYYCAMGSVVNGRSRQHIHIGGIAVETAVVDTVLAALAPAALQACLAAAEALEAGHDTALAQWRREVERARYTAAKAERRYRAVDPENRLVARGLEATWETALRDLADAETELARRETARPKTLSTQERNAILALGDNLDQVWAAPTTTNKDRKQLLRTLLDEVNITRDREAGQTHLVVRWKGGAISDLTITTKRHQPQRRTDETTLDLLRRLAVHYPDATIASVLNRQGRRTAHGLSFTASRVQSLRQHHNIAGHQPTNQPQDAPVLTITNAAAELGIAPSTLHRWINDGFIAGEQITPGAPWRIRLTDQLRDLFVDNAPNGWVLMEEATKRLGVSRQTVLQRVKRGELQAVHVRTGRRKGLRINVPSHTHTLF